MQSQSELSLKQDWSSVWQLGQVDEIHHEMFI